MSTVYYQYTAVYLRVYGRIPGSIRPYTRSIRRKICAESYMLCACCMRLCARFHWATGPHMPGTSLHSNYCKQYVCKCPSEGEGALNCLESIQDFCEGIKHRHLTPYAVCALHPQTSTPAPYFVSHVMAHPVFFYNRIAGKEGNGNDVCGCNR